MCGSSAADANCTINESTLAILTTGAATFWTCRAMKHFWAQATLATLEAQKRYFSYRAILVAIVPQNSFVFAFMGVSHNYRAICSKMGYRTDARVWNSVLRGAIAPFWGSADLPQKVSRDAEYRSNSIAISLAKTFAPYRGHLGLSGRNDPCSRARGSENIARYMGPLSWEPILHPRRQEEGLNSSMADALSSPSHRPCRSRNCSP